ncbi:hypothetical protein I7I53_07091 [Histoplasma capsulatum var. duboisii H88]|uniref:Uncharacterized protein n=1 Tax=Ajellomyces capsulatus (strain H88) TaxID=544711 RepID=A0A8A1LBC6_AJEC8|nr:hypothetical protein I7I53_07091 [Histoplasma capsulatum var. duboisii H88]
MCIRERSCLRRQSIKLDKEGAGRIFVTSSSLCMPALHAGCRAIGNERLFNSFSSPFHTGSCISS